MQAGGRGFEPHPLHGVRAGFAWWPVLAGVLLLSLAGGLGSRAFLSARAERDGYVAQMAGDIERLRLAQTRFLADSGRFGSREELGELFVPSQGVFLELTQVGNNDWTGAVWHIRIAIGCRFSREMVTCE